MAKGLEFAKDLALTKYSLETDYLEIVNRVNSTVEDFSDIGHIIQEIKKENRNSCCLGIQHTRRLVNVPTHILGKYAYELVEFRSQLYYPNQFG